MSRLTSAIVYERVTGVITTPYPSPTVNWCINCMWRFGRL